MNHYSYSFNEEEFHAGGDTIEEAIHEAMKNIGEYEAFWIGESEPPTQPEEWWEASDWLEHVSVQDEYGGEWAEGWDSSTKEQRVELEKEVKAVMAAWLDRHKLRPEFFTVSNIVKYEIANGVPYPVR